MAFGSNGWPLADFYAGWLPDYYHHEFNFDLISCVQADSILNTAVIGTLRGEICVLRLSDPASARSLGLLHTGVGELGLILLFV